MILLVQNSHSAGNRNREQEGNLETAQTLNLQKLCIEWVILGLERETIWLQTQYTYHPFPRTLSE